MMKKKLLLFCGHFWSYGIYLLTFLLAFTWLELCLKIEALNEYHWAFLTILGVGFCANGLNLILASIFRKKHILLIEQFTTHQKMNPDEITWNEFNPKPHITGGIVICFSGILVIIYSIILAI